MIEVRGFQKLVPISHQAWTDDHKRNLFLLENFGVKEQDLSSLVLVPIYKDQFDQSHPSQKEKRLLTFIEVQTSNLSEIKELVLVPEFRGNRVTAATITDLKKTSFSVMIRSSSIRLIVSCFTLCKEALFNQNLVIDHLYNSHFDMEYAVFYRCGPDGLLYPEFTVPISTSLPHMILAWLLHGKTPTIIKTSTPSFEFFQEKVLNTLGPDAPPEMVIRVLWLLHPYSAKLFVSQVTVSSSVL